MTPLLSLKQTCLDGSEIAGGNEASAFAPAVSSSAERPAETSEMHDLQQQKHMLSIYVCATSNCSSCRWALLFLAASRGQIGGYSDGRRRGSSRLTPRDAPRHRGPRLRFATGSSHLFLA